MSNTREREIPSNEFLVPRGWSMSKYNVQIQETPLVNITPKKNKHIGGSVVLGKLAVVNREEASEAMARLLVLNALYGDDKLRKLVVISAMNGQGKTTIGYEFRNVMEKKKIWNKLSEEYKQDHIAIQVMNNLKNAIYVRVDCIKFAIYRDLPFSKAIVKIVKNALLIPDEEYKDDKRSLPQNTINLLIQNQKEFDSFQEFYNWLESTDPESGYIFHFDEVDSIQNPDTDTKYGQNLKEFYDLWAELMFLLRSKKSFCFVSGKSPAFSLIGFHLYGSRSPTSVAHILLQPLDINYTIFAAKMTTIHEKSLNDVLFEMCNADDTLLERLYVCLHFVTGGIPRMVYVAYNVLYQKRNTITFSNFDSIESFFKNEIYNEICKECFELKKYTLLDGWQQEIYFRLLTIGMLDLPIDISKNIYIYFRNRQVPIEIPLLHFATITCNFYFSPNDLKKATYFSTIDKENTFARLVFPGALIWYLQSFLDPRLIISFRLKEILTTDRGKLLEIIGALTFIIHISIRIHLQTTQYWSDMSFMGGIFFKSSFFKDKKIDKLQNDIISILPSFMKDIDDLTDHKKIDLLRNPWSHKVNYNDLGWVLEKLWKPNTIAIFDSQSESSDAGLRFPNEQFFLLIAYKNYGANNGLNKSTVVEEIQKASLLLNQLTEDSKVCLTIIATNIGYELETVIGNEASLTLKTGIWSFAKGKVNNVKKRKKNTLEVPDRMEVIIVGKKGLNAFLGEMNVEKLKSISDKKNQVEAHSNLVETLFSLMDWNNPTYSATLDQFNNNKTYELTNLGKCL